MIGHQPLELLAGVLAAAIRMVQERVRLIVNTIRFSLATLVVSMAFGISAAWLVERTDFPGKIILFILMTLGLLIPGFTSAKCPDLESAGLK